jgi:hypothetical protein
VHKPTPDNVFAWLSFEPIHKAPMPASWRDGLVNAFPIPADRFRSKKGLKKDKYLPVSHTTEPEEEPFDTDVPIKEPFRFLDLPPEIRNRVYAIALLSKSGYRGLDGKKKTAISLLTVNKKVHIEASYVLYSSQSFRIFPLQDFMPKPVIQELRPMYRSMVTKLEMVVGSSWTSPPKTWRVSKLLAKRLGTLTAVQTLRVMVELDPSLPMFEKYRISPEFYTNFCGNLLRDVLVAMPGVMFIELDGNPGVDTSGPLVRRLLKEADSIGKTVRLGTTKPVATHAGFSICFWPKPA